MLYNDIPSRTSTEPVIESLLNFRKSETTVTAKSRHVARAALIFGYLPILALDGTE